MTKEQTGRPEALVLAPYLSHEHAGAAHATIDIINALHRRGKVGVTVISFEVVEETLHPEVPVILVPPPPPLVGSCGASDEPSP